VRKGRGKPNDRQRGANALLLRKKKVLLGLRRDKRKIRHDGEGTETTISPR